MVDQKAKGVTSAVKRGAGGLAGETLKRTGSTVRGATSAVSGAPGTDAVEGVGEQVQEVARGAGGAVEGAVGGGGAGRGGEQRTVGEELRGIVREAALEVLAPAARSATAHAAKYAIRRAPQLARDTIAPKLADTLGPASREAGGPGASAKGALSSISSARSGILEKVGIGGEAPARPWRERRLPVEESIDVVVPLETAYDRFTELDEYARFLSRGEIADERPDERITWRRTDGVDATAVVSFHRLSDRLTRVMVTYDHQPQGLLEQSTSLFRSSRRGLSADLMRFKAFVEMSEEDTEASEEEPERQAAEPRARRGTRTRPDEDEYAEEDESAEEEAPEGEYEEEPEAEEEEEPRPAPRRPARRRPAAPPRQPQARRR